MRIFDANMDVGETSNREWLKDAYQRIDDAIAPLLNLEITDAEKKEMEDFLPEDDHIGRAIWMIATYSLLAAEKEKK